MPNHGERTLVVKTSSGNMKVMRCQVTPCIGPLAGTAQMTDADNLACLSKEASFLYDQNSGQVEMLDRVDDTFEMELEIVPYAEAKPMLEKHAGFQGQP